MEAIQQISEVINQINDISNTIASAVEEQTATANEMSRNVPRPPRGREKLPRTLLGAPSGSKHHAGRHNAQQAASELARMAAELQQLVSQFKYEKQEELRPTPASRDAANRVAGNSKTRSQQVYSSRP